MTHGDIAERFSAYLDQELDSSEEHAVEIHLATCDQCRQDLEGLRETVDLLHGLEKISAPPGFVARVRKRARRRTRQVAGVHNADATRFKLPAETIAVIMIAVMAIMILLLGEQPKVREVKSGKGAKSKAVAAPPRAAPKAGKVKTTPKKRLPGVRFRLGPGDGK